MTVRFRACFLTARPTTVMQAGFAFLEAGGVSAKNVVNVLHRKLFDASATSVIFYFLGFVVRCFSSSLLLLLWELNKNNKESVGLC